MATHNCFIRELRSGFRKQNTENKQLIELYETEKKRHKLEDSGS